MTATMLDFRNRMSEIQSAVNRRERVTVTYRNKPWAVLVAIDVAPAQSAQKPVRARDLAAAGMWRDREDMKDPTAWVREMRRGRQFL